MVSVTSSFPSFNSHTRRVLSQEPETARRPSELSATAVTQKVWPLSLRLKDEFVMMFQTFECLEFPGKGHIHATSFPRIRGNRFPNEAGVSIKERFGMPAFF